MARVALKSVTKRFEDVVAVNNVSLEAKDKEFVIFLGPSGCGKTTSLRCIAGLESPEEGEIWIGDTLVNELEPKDRNIAMVFQNYALYPHMTVYKNMAFPLENFGYAANEIHRKILDSARLLQIEPLLGRKPGELSGGQQQRAALGRAIVREPQAFLMDEPLSNLDAKLRLYMRAELKRLQKDLGVTTIYVTHDQVEAMTMGDRIAIMEKGNLQQMDTPNQIYTRPANQFVAGFIGNPPFNFFDCTFKGDRTLDAGEFQYQLPEEFAKLVGKASSSEVVMGIRPQDIRVSIEDQGQPDQYHFKIFTTEPMGDVTILDIEVGDTLVKVVVSPDFMAEAGTDVWLTFPADRIYFFDKRTGKALA